MNQHNQHSERAPMPKDATFEEKFSRVFSPSMAQLLSIQLAPSLSYSSVAAYLKLDPLLAGKVLHLINAPAYGFTQKFTDLQRAAAAVGTANILKIFLALSMQKIFAPMGKRAPALVNGDWRICLWSAVGAEAIATHLCPQETRQAFLAGLLKDIALQFALAGANPPPFMKGASLAAIAQKKHREQEIHTWQRSHEDLAADTLEEWGLPADLVGAVRLHHETELAADVSPLARCLILATRWAEILHGFDASPADIISFEGFLAGKLGLHTAQMDSFRAECAENYALLLAQLDIPNLPQEFRLYERPLTELRDFYFLAHRVLDALDRESPRAAAERLLHQLRDIWQADTWNLFLSQDASGSGESFCCDQGKLKLSASSGPPAASPAMGWAQLSIGNHRREFGSLHLPRPQAGVDNGSLPVYLHILGMCMDDRRRDIAEITLNAGLMSSPFILARIDETSCIRDASPAFLETMGLTHVPTGRHAGELLQEKLGIGLPRFDRALERADARGMFVSAPEGHFPGTPVYVAHYASPFGGNDSLLQLGDIAPMSPLQVLALSHKELLETLFKSIEENFCLLDCDGLVLWADAELDPLVGQNFFALTAGAAANGEAVWNASVLARLTEPGSFSAHVPCNGVNSVRALRISPLGTGPGRQYLVVMHQAGSSRAHSTAHLPQTAKQRDPLTGLYGYSQFHLLLQHLVQLGKKQRSHIGILFCLVDSLRQINSDYGFQKGDYVLSRVADCMATACRPGRDYPCRYGANKFAIIVTRATKTLMDSMAQSILDHMETHADLYGKAGIGMALIPPGQTARPKLDLARKAAKDALELVPPILWTQ